MGMYTELFVKGSLKEGAPDDVVSIIEWMFGEDTDCPKDALKNHPQIKEYFNYLTRCNSYYHVPISTRAVERDEYGPTRDVHFVSRADVKNYGGEIEAFIEWVKPYCYLLRGWHWYEEDESPTVFKYESYD